MIRKDSHHILMEVFDNTWTILMQAHSENGNKIMMNMNEISNNSVPQQVSTKVFSPDPAGSYSSFGSFGTIPVWEDDSPPLLYMAHVVGYD